MSNSVPDRSVYDPLLGATLHTGGRAIGAGACFSGGDLAIDIETPGLDRAFDINCITMAWREAGRVVSILLDPARVPRHHRLARDMIARADRLILHNAPFDTPGLWHAGLIDAAGVNRITDTLVLARFAFPDTMVRKSLEALAIAHLGWTDFSDGMKRAFHAAGFKTIQDGYENMDIDSPIYRQGAMADTVATLALEPVLRSRALHWATDHPFVHYGPTDAASAAELLATQETVNRVMLRRTARGLGVDTDYLDRYSVAVEAERAKHFAALSAAGLEGGSGKAAALVEYLESVGELPVQWPRTPTGKLRATKADLEHLEHPLADAQRALAVTDKVTGYLAKVTRQAEVTGRCHPQVGVLGASATGRMAYGSPELQQFPADARGVITDTDGTGLTSIDWAQIEPVTMALMARDTAFLAPFEAGADLYEPIQRAAGVPRPVAKVVLLATMYGQGTNSLAAAIGHSPESAAQIRRQMLAAMPGCARWMSKVQEIAAQYGRTITAAGRILPVDPGFDYKAVNYCLGLDTLILRADLTHVPAREIQVGDALVGFDEYPTQEPGNTNRYRQLRTATVEAVSTVVKPSVVVRLHDDTETLCSADHLWLVRRSRYLDWVRADELRIGDELMSLGTWQVDESRDAGYLAGLLDGEGHLARNATVAGRRKSCQLGFSQLDGPVMESYKATMRKLGLPYAYRQPGITDTSPTSQATTSGVRTVMRVLGTLQPERFKPRFREVYEGRAITAGLAETLTVSAVTPVGNYTLASIQTSTRTLVANGLLSHNCIQGSALDVLHHTICEMERCGIADELHLAMHDELVVSTPVADEVRRIMQTPPEFLTRWAGRSTTLRTDSEELGRRWAKV